MTAESGDDRFDIGSAIVNLKIKNDSVLSKGILSGHLTTFNPLLLASKRIPINTDGIPAGNVIVWGVPGTNQILADDTILSQSEWVGSTADVIGLMPRTTASFSFVIETKVPGFLYVTLATTQPGYGIGEIVEGATYIGDVHQRNGAVWGRAYRISNSTPTPAPTPAPGGGGGRGAGGGGGGISDVPPVLADCSFPTFTPNLWAYFGALFEWIGCILHNIITLIQWIVDWFLHFPDHLDAWVSRLFGIDPALPFWDELEKKRIAILIAAAKQIIDILFADSDFWKNRKHPR